ncbi:MAG: heparinase II/III family protein [Petrimonas sp.]
MFGDTARNKKRSDDRKLWPLYNTLVEASEKFKDPKYRALADLDFQYLPSNGSVAFENAGLYSLRNNWTPEQVYMALHCSQSAISIHDTPDNGTFEIYAYGKWLMPDTGFFTYGHDKNARNWHRQTKVHPTMTVDGKDSFIKGRHILWQSDENQDILCVENESYTYFVHRRTVWFAGKKSKIPFFVILDEAIGDVKGDIALHFPMAPGDVKIDKIKGLIYTDFEDVNLSINVIGKKPLDFVSEDGWSSWKYGNREKRTSVSAIYKGQGPFVFVSLLIPYKGKSFPECRILTDPKTLFAGMSPVKLDVEVSNEKWSFERKT